MTEPQPQAHGFSRGSRLRRAKARIVAPGWDDGGCALPLDQKTLYSARYHLFWCPKYRRRVLVGGVDQRLKLIVGDVAAEVGAEVFEVEVMPDRGRLLAEVPLMVSLSRLVGLAEGRSSRPVPHEFPRMRRLPVLRSPSWWCPRSAQHLGGRPSIRGEPEGRVVR